MRRTSRRLGVSPYELRSTTPPGLGQAPAHLTSVGHIPIWNCHFVAVQPVAFRQREALSASLVVFSQLPLFGLAIETPLRERPTLPIGVRRRSCHRLA